MIVLRLVLQLVISVDSRFLAWAYQKNADSGPGDDIDEDQAGDDCDGGEWQLPYQRCTIMVGSGTCYEFLLHPWYKYPCRSRKESL